MCLSIEKPIDTSLLEKNKNSAITLLF